MNTLKSKYMGIADMRIVYLWYYHFNPKVKIKEIEIAINNHDWKTFKKWLEWQEEQNLMYFPDYADVYVNGEYLGELLINEENFNLITNNDYECG